MEYDITITISGHGRDPAAGERMLEGFLAAHPESEPVVDQNTETDELSVTYTVAVAAGDDVFESARVVFADGAAAAGLEPATVTSASIAAAPESELQPA